MFHLLRELLARYYYSRHIHWNRVASGAVYESPTSLPAIMGVSVYKNATKKAESYMDKLKSLQKELNQ